jgi:hypothetical protein
VRFGELAGNGQTQTGSTCRALSRSVDPIERPKDGIA